jgi:hypothetical protein
MFYQGEGEILRGEKECVYANLSTAHARVLTLKRCLIEEACQNAASQVREATTMILGTNIAIDRFLLELYKGLGQRVSDLRKESI